ncbi:MAG: ArnT family glycosyltransferase [Pyrinomonadaceae bacterium]
MTKKHSPFRIPHSAFIWILFALTIVVVYFFVLSIPLLGPDEPRYAQVAREMLQRNDWITPTLGGFDWFEKPALLYWLQIVSYKLFGVSEFAARFGPALFGLGTIFSLWVLGKTIQSSEFKVQGSEFGVQGSELETQKSESEKQNSSFIIHHSSFANWLALIAASSIGLLAFSRGASFDIILTFPITASLVGFFIFDQSKTKTGFTFHRSLFTFYFFIGVSLIAKGLVGIIFPFAIVAFYYVLLRKMPSKTFLFSLLWGTILSLLVASVWYVPMYRANGWKFIDEFIIQHHFERFTSNKYQHPQPFWFFFLVLPLMTIPWLPFFLAAIWKILKNFKSVIRNPQSAFALAWMLVPLVFFSLSGSKLPGYILPALPAALILTAEYIYRFVQHKPYRKIVLQLLALTTFVLTVIALQFFVADYARNDTVKNLIAAADAQGFSQAKILNLYDISHNAEFYGAGRLVRTPDGKQKRFDGAGEIYQELNRENEPALVLVPLDDVKYLTQSDLLNTKVLGDNGELAIVAVEKR